MSKKLIGALVAGSVLVLPVSGAQAKKVPKPHPRNDCGIVCRPSHPSHPSHPRHPTHPSHPTGRGGGRPAGPAKDASSVLDPCFGVLPGRVGPQCDTAHYTYTYVCLPAFYPKQLAVFTNSDATEDYYESRPYHYWRCSGTPDD